MFPTRVLGARSPCPPFSFSEFSGTGFVQQEVVTSFRKTPLLPLVPSTVVGTSPPDSLNAGGVEVGQDPSLPIFGAGHTYCDTQQGQQKDPPPPMKATSLLPPDFYPAGGGAPGPPIQPRCARPEAGPGGWQECTCPGLWGGHRARPGLWCCSS